MNIRKALKTTTIIGALAFAPMAATARAALVPSNSREASRLLKDMRQDALQVGDRASLLRNFAVSPEVYRDSHAIELRRIRADVNDMGRRLNQLQAMQGTVAPWQQRAIQQAAPLVQFMADNTTDAIKYMNAHQGGFWAASYRQDVHRLDKEAHTLAKDIHIDKRSASLE